MVAPFAGAWIEIPARMTTGQSKMSLPSRGRGLKFIPILTRNEVKRVAPFAGAWIEIGLTNDRGLSVFASLPSRGRGLKYNVTS